MDEDLIAIQRLQGGDEKALVELMDRYREPIFRLAYRYTANVADARELTEETFTRVYFNASAFRPRASVKAWVFTIAANLCRDFLRRNKKHRQVQPLLAPKSRDSDQLLEESIPDPARNAAERVAEAEAIEHLRTAIQGLPEKLRFPFVFCILEGHRYDEAAAVLGTSTKTVEMRIYRARKELQSRL